ncbi:MAG: haloacid dehalogenase [SAR202 cluster bacterium]|nr:haloacid dehalogenase [SAR202 cluster bacterium]|tara:strand:- start:3563 stop:4279 length:717 start_codon:yes stop_codon:yes gene_type:complete
MTQKNQQRALSIKYKTLVINKLKPRERTMNNIIKSIETNIELSKKDLESIHNKRETVYPLTRQIIHLCSAAIKNAHRKQYDESLKLVNEAKVLIDKINNESIENTPIMSSGYVLDAQKEFTEANVALAFLTNKEIPTALELSVQISPYLNGIAEAASELRRTILDALRSDNLDSCETWMECMDETYSMLAGIDYPEAVTGGLRRTVDQLRGVLERTRGDLTMSLRQKALENKLDNLHL